MSDPLDFSRRIRRKVERNGLIAQIAADVNVVVSSGGTSATARQDTRIQQSRRGRSDRTDHDARDRPDLEEQP